MSPLDELLVEHVALRPGERAVVYAAGQGTAALALARACPQAAVEVIETDFIVRRILSQGAASAKTPNLSVYTHIAPFPDEPPGERRYDCAIVLVPKGRLLAQRWLAQSAARLSPGGRLALAGPKDLGVQSAGRDAEALLGSRGVVLGYKKGQRVIGFSIPAALPAPPDWAQRDGLAPGTWAALEVETPVGRLALKTLPGVFAFDALDDGTRLLLEHLHVSEQDDVLDLGCGMGVIGLVAALQGARRVDLVDVNLLAVAAARRNLLDLGPAQAQVFPSDALSAVEGRAYTLIASNPPFHAGKEVDYRAAEAFLRHGRRALAQGGRLALVANRFIRYDRIMAGLFTRVETLAADSRFHVLCGWA